MKQLRDHRFADAETQKAWDELQKEWNGAQAVGLFVNGVLLKTISLTTANREFFHGLGRVPVHLFATMMNANATVFSDTPHATPRTHVYVKASAAVTVNLVIA